MGDMADLARDRAEELEFDCIAKYGMGALQAYEAGLIDEDGQPVDQFDVIGTTVDVISTPAPPVQTEDPLRPEAKRGRYYLPDPATGKTIGWRRMTNFCKPFEDTYHLELWKQRNVAKGIAQLIVDGRIELEELARLDVKEDRERINRMVEAAQDAAEAYKMSDEGTALHKSSELANHAGGDLNRVPVHHRDKIRLYLDALAANGMTIVPNMIERVTVSKKYGAAGKFDLITRLPDGSCVVTDLKTGDDLERSMPGIATQLEGYENGINTHGIFDGHRYDQTVRVRDDIGLVIWLPSTRDEVSIIEVDLNEGRRINRVNVEIFEARKRKAQHVSRPFEAARYGVSQAVTDAHWREQMNAAWTRPQLVDVARRAKVWGQWNEGLANVARNLEAELRNDARMNGMDT